MKTSLAPGSPRRHRLPRQGRPDRVPRPARLQPRRLRLHDLHRQLRPACPTRSPRRSTTKDLVASRGALRQPQLRGPHQPGREGQLPGVAAAGRRLRARRHDRHRSRPASRSATGNDGKPVYLGTSGRPSRRSTRSIGRSIASEHVHRSNYADVFDGDETVAGRSRSPTGDRYAWEPDSTYIRQPPFFDRHDRRRRRRIKPTSRRARARCARRLDHHRPHLARRRDQDRQPGRRNT